MDDNEDFCSKKQFWLARRFHKNTKAFCWPSMLLMFFRFEPKYILEACVYEKCFLFHLESSFPSRDIQIFVFLSFSIFPPVSHCFRGWSRIDLKVYNVKSCPNTKLITHFVWYLEKEKRYDVETLSIDIVLNKEHLYGNVMQKMCTKS